MSAFVVRFIDNIGKNGFNQTLRHSLNYFISNIAVSALGVVSLPVITRLLTTSEYGILSVFNTYLVMFYSLLTLNTYISVGRYYFEGKENFKEFFGTLIVFVFILLSLIYLPMVIFQNSIAGLLKLPTHVIKYIVPLVLFFVFNSWYTQIFASQRRSARVTVRNVVNAYSIFLFSVIFIWLLPHNKYLGQIYASLIIGIAFSIYYYYELRPYIILSFNLHALKYALIYSVPLLPYSLSGVILDQFDRIMINKYTGFSDAGLYTFAYNIGMLLTMVLSALHQAWGPDYFKHMDDKNYTQLNSDIKKMLRILLVCALFLIFFGREIGMVLGKSSYHSALGIVPIIVIGYFFYSFFTFFAWNIQYAKRNIYLSGAVIFSGAVNIVLNAMFIPRYGYIAAAYTTALSYALMALLGWLVSKSVLRYDFMPLNILFKSILLLTPFLALYYLILYSALSLWIGIVLKLLIFIIFSYIVMRKYIIHFTSIAKSN